MDATRPRRTRDRIRQDWYARQRSVRFARRLGFCLTHPAAEPEAPPCILPAGSPWLTLDGPVAGTSPLVLAGDVFVHVTRLGVLASFLWASLAWRSSQRLCPCPLLFRVG
jgi:hypothetical protein